MEGGHPNLITAFTSRHLSISCARSVQSTPRSADFLGVYFNINPPIYTWVFQVVSFLQVSPTKSCMHLSSAPYVLHSPPLSLFLT